MAAIYSQLLAAVRNIAIGAPSVGGPVPTGYIWIVRDIVAFNLNTTPGWILGMFLSSTSDNVPIFSTPPQSSQCQLAYHWEGRQVLNTGGGLTAHTVGNNWCIRVSGYALTTP